MTNRNFVMVCLAPLFIFSLAFLALPLIQLFLGSGSGEAGWAVYLDILRKPRYLNTLVLSALLESAAGEQAASMTAMDNATRNAGELIDKLTLQYNRARQAQITKELIEIISGAEAL